MSKSSMFRNVIKTLAVQLNTQHSSVRFVRSIRSRNLLRTSTSQDEVNRDDGATYFEDELDDTFQETLPATPSKIERSNKDLKREQKEFVKRKIIQAKERKYFEGRDSYLLTWAAICQIQHLNKDNPEEWTPDALAHCFPVTMGTIIKILRMKRLPYDEAEIVRHDRKVYRNWMRLKAASKTDEDGGPIDPEYSHPVRQEQLSKMVNAAGIASLPSPSPDQMFLTQTLLAERKKPHADRKFSSLLDKPEVTMVTKLQKPKMDSRILEIEDARMVSLLSGFSKEETMSSNSDSVNDSDAVESQLFPSVKDVKMKKQLSQQERSMLGHSQYTQHENYSAKKDKQYVNTGKNDFSFKINDYSSAGRVEIVKEITKGKELKQRRKSGTKLDQHVPVGDMGMKGTFMYEKGTADSKECSGHIKGSKLPGQFGEKDNRRQDFETVDDELHEDVKGLTGNLEDIMLLGEKSRPRKKSGRNN